ncbi:helix-turn-helix domain-containing protein [Amycolatopsis magusensis]|uniref:helix-turn-helix domain-containing protein n=1 Tax=Amycolatopsis magusensis TaxID=882444 RepID=UPI003795DCB4
MARTTPDGPASRPGDRTLAELLSAAAERRKREAGISIRSIGAQLGLNHTTVGRWINGKTVPTYEQVVSVVTALGLVDAEKEQILEIARNPSPSLVTTGPAGIASPLAGVLAHEREATTMTEWLPLFIPGMLQTEDYARAVITKSNRNATSVEIDHLVTLRMGRQRAITRKDPIQFTALIGEPAIEGRVGGDRVMKEQLEYLLEVTERDNVNLLVVPVDGDWHDGLVGPFVHYGFPKGSGIVYLEHFRGTLFLNDAADASDYRELVNLLTEVAYSPADSLARVRERMQSGRRHT